MGRVLGHPREVDLGDGERFKAVALHHGHVEFPALDELFDQGGLLIGIDDLADLLVQGFAVEHDGVFIDARTGVFLVGLDDGGKRHIHFLVGRCHQPAPGRRQAEGIEDGLGLEFVLADGQRFGGIAGERHADGLEHGSDVMLELGPPQETLAQVDEHIDLELLQAPDKAHQARMEREHGGRVAVIGESGEHGLRHFGDGLLGQLVLGPADDGVVSVVSDPDHGVFLIHS